MGCTCGSQPQWSWFALYSPPLSRVFSDKIDEYREEFSTFKMSYSHEDTEKLLTAAKKNVVNVQQKILEEIRRIVGPSSQNA